MPHRQWGDIYFVLLKTLNTKTETIHPKPSTLNCILQGLSRRRWRAVQCVLHGLMFTHTYTHTHAPTSAGTAPKVLLICILCAAQSDALLSLSLSHTHTHTHTHTHIHTHTHTHTHALSRSLSLMCTLSLSLSLAIAFSPPLSSLSPSLPPSLSRSLSPFLSLSLSLFLFRFLTLFGLKCGVTRQLYSCHDYPRCVTARATIATGMSRLHYFFSHSLALTHSLSLPLGRHTHVTTARGDSLWCCCFAFGCVWLTFCF